jgi:hypothetical protein
MDGLQQRALKGVARSIARLSVPRRSGLPSWIMLYCETVFAITEYPPNQLIVKRPESGIGRPAPCPPSAALSQIVGALTLCPPCGLSTSLRANGSQGRGDNSIQISNSRCASAFSRRDVARVMQERCPSKEEGTGNAGCALHPRSRVQIVQKKAHTSIQVQRRQSDIPCAMALRLTSRSPRRIGLCCLRRLRIAGSSAPSRADLPSADLTPTTEAPGPHDFTVRFSIVRPHVL